MGGVAGERARYAGLSVAERLARLRRVWERKSKGKRRLTVQLTLDSIMEDLLSLGQRLGDREDIGELNVVGIRFELEGMSPAARRGASLRCVSPPGSGSCAVRFECPECRFSSDEAMVRFNFSAASYYVPGAPWHIADAPRFPHRGLMVDTSRHFETLASLRAIIDSLPYAKVNVLHWHMSQR